MGTNSNSKGFTLLELLVVIAIIGVLSAIIVAVTNKPRKDANMANIKANLITIQKQAELFYLINGKYGNESSNTSCSPASRSGTLYADQTVNSAIVEILKRSRGGNKVRCYVKDGGNKWSVGIQMPVEYGFDFCADSTGYVGTIGFYFFDAASGYCAH